MCCGSNTQTSVTTPTVPDWLEDYYKYQTAGQKELYETARDIYNARGEYPTYTDQRIQPFTTDELQSFDVIRDNLGVEQPGMGAATARNTQAGRTYADMGGVPYISPGVGVSTYADMGGVPYAPSGVGIDSLTEQNLAPYMSPYTDSVINSTLSDMREQSAREGLAMQGAATRAGSFGGSRQGLQDALREDRLNRSIGSVGSQLRQQGYQSALSARDAEQRAGLQAALANQGAAASAEALNRSTFQSDQAAQLQAALANQGAGAGAAALNRATFQSDQQRMMESGALAADLAQQQQQQLIANATVLSAQGAQQRQMGQSGMNLGYQDFQAQQAYPYAQLGSLQSAITATPFNPAMFTGQTTTSPGGSMLGQVAGLGIAGLGMYMGNPSMAAGGVNYAAKAG
jgi:hypothetical protein|tara:strand:+ start:1349 stop:2551 length:1203 start_codon:yes stop_codon:yes gene_type:complete